MIGILFATDREAAPFLNEMNRMSESATADEGATRFLLPDREVAVAVVGMGKRLAKKGAIQFIERYRPHCIINAGIAGALSDDLLKGELYRVSSAVDWPRRANRPFVLSDRGFEDLPSARLVTSDNPVFSDEIRRELQPFGDAVDMEGAIIAEVCLSMSIECIEIKCISDFAKDGDQKTLFENIDTASDAAAFAFARRL